MNVLSFARTVNYCMICKGARRKKSRSFAIFKNMYYMFLNCKNSDTEKKPLRMQFMLRAPLTEPESTNLSDKK